METLEISEIKFACSVLQRMHEVDGRILYRRLSERLYSLYG